MMEYLLIPLTCILATAKVLIQSKFAKDMTKKPIDAILFNGLIFTVSATILAYRLIGAPIGIETIIAGLIVGFGHIVFQTGYIFAFTTGPVSLTTLIVTTSMIFPVITSKILYNEPLTGNRIFGIILVILALYFSKNTEKQNKVNLKWTVFTLIAFFGNCIMSVTQKVYTTSYSNGNTSSFVAIHFLISAIISLVICRILRGKKATCSYKLNTKVLVTISVIGCILGVFHIIYTYALSVIDATKMIPMYNGGQALLVTICGVIFFKEKLTKRQYISIIMGITAIILISI